MGIAQDDTCVSEQGPEDDNGLVPLTFSNGVGDTLTAMLTPRGELVDADTLEVLTDLNLYQAALSYCHDFDIFQR